MSKAPIVKKSQILALLQPIAETFKVAVTELWKIFVRQYIVRGLSEVFTAICLFVGGYLMIKYTGGNVKLWGIAPIVGGIVFVYDAIQLVGNPQYFALDDIIKRVKNET